MTSLNKSKGRLTPQGKLHPQLPLALQAKEDFVFGNYVSDRNTQVVELLKRELFGEGGADRYLYLWGKAGVGKSHLLQAACQEATNREMSAIYLPMGELVQMAPEILSGVESIDLVCIDNMEVISDRGDWQEATFHLFNRIREEQKRLLVAAAAAPQNIGIQLADLVSRLASGVICQLDELSEVGKRQLLQQKAGQAGLELSAEASQFILNRATRGAPDLLATLGCLDRASLSSARKLTIPFIKETMGW